MTVTGRGGIAKRTTNAQRKELFNRLARDFNRWLKASDAEIFSEVQVILPSVQTGTCTREECLKFLVMDHVDKMVP